MLAVFVVLIFLWQLEDKDRTKLSFEASSAMTIPVILERIRDRYCLLTFVEFLWVVVVICFCPTAYWSAMWWGIGERGADSTNLTSGWLWMNDSTRGERKSSLGIEEGMR
jgi:hypothetical protein